MSSRRESEFSVGHGGVERARRLSCLVIGRPDVRPGSGAGGEGSPQVRRVGAMRGGDTPFVSMGAGSAKAPARGPAARCWLWGAGEQERSLAAMNRRTVHWRDEAQCRGAPLLGCTGAQRPCRRLRVLPRTSLRSTPRLKQTQCDPGGTTVSHDISRVDGGISLERPAAMTIC